MLVLKRFLFYVFLLKMFCWSSLELIFLIKLGRFIMLINLGFVDFVNVVKEVIKSVIIVFIYI